MVSTPVRDSHENWQATDVTGVAAGPLNRSHDMQQLFFLSSMDSGQFSSVCRCEVLRPIELPNGHHALMVSCDPPVNGQELGHPLGIGELLLWSRFEDEDLWTFPTFPHFVQVCLPDADLPADAMPPSIAWGEIYETEADARSHEMDARPSERARRNPDCPTKCAR